MATKIPAWLPWGSQAMLYWTTSAAAAGAGTPAARPARSSPASARHRRTRLPMCIVEPPVARTPRRRAARPAGGPRGKLAHRRADGGLDLVLGRLDEGLLARVEGNGDVGGGHAADGGLEGAEGL